MGSMGGAASVREVLLSVASLPFALVFAKARVESLNSCITLTLYRLPREMTSIFSKQHKTCVCPGVHVHTSVYLTTYQEPYRDRACFFMTLCECRNPACEYGDGKGCCTQVCVRTLDDKQSYAGRYSVSTINDASILACGLNRQNTWDLNGWYTRGLVYCLWY
jgi:hypothetical protein